jgi:hypothetical protein
MAGTIYAWSWGGAAARQAPFGAAASITLLAAGCCLLIGAMVVRRSPELRRGRLVLPAVVAAWAVVAWLATAAVLTMVSGELTVWFQLLWTDGFAIAFATGLTKVGNRLRRGRAAERRAA